MPHPTRVLVVEDVAAIARVTEEMLRRTAINRHAPTVVSRLADALVALGRERYDLVLLDLNLPDSRDLATVARVIEHAPEVPIIVLTATNDEEAGRRAVQLGAQDFLLKGEFTLTMLDRAIMFAVERHRLQRTLRQLAVMDELTGLYNRRGFNALQSDFLLQARTARARGFLCCFDLDDFKLINDCHGHAAGDEALQEFAHCLRSVFRRDALLARIGGDEFVVLGLEAAPGEFGALRAAVNRELEARNSATGTRASLAASCGWTVFQGPDVPDIGRLSAAADESLYRDKMERKHQRAAIDRFSPAARPR